MKDPLNAIMLREIESQPSYVKDALSSLRTSAESAAKRVVNGTTTGFRVWAGGCGDSYFAATALSELFRGLGIEYAPATAQDLASYPRVSTGDVVVLISISGSTHRTVEAARTAADLGAGVIAITCNSDSALGRASDAVVELPYQPITRSTPHTLDYAMSLLALAALAEALSGRTIDQLASIGDIMQDALPPAEEAARTVAQAALKKLEGGLEEVPAFFFLGAGPHRGTALYGAAKFYEAGGLRAYAEETENFVHGMNFVLEPGDVACVLASDARDREWAVRLIQGLSRLGARTLAVGFECGAADASVNAHIALSADERPISADVRTHAVLPFLESLPVQLLCYHVARLLGLDVEKPRAGRPGAELHANVQNDWMRSS